MSQALYRKWRPARFNEVIGQEHVTRTLRNSVAADRVGHAYLFCGPRGTGKTTTARLLAKALNCLHADPAERPCNVCANCVAVREGRFLDLIEIDAASNTGVDDIRDLREKINYAPSEGRYKVYIVDEVHMLSAAAFNALLKTLEEPPPHAKFVLATTEEHKVPMTIKSRCQQFNFRLLSAQEIVSRLAWLAEQEALHVEPEALRLVARHGAGSLRDAESLLDQLVTAPEATIDLARVQMVLGTASMALVRDLTDAWLDGDGRRGLQLIGEALSTGVDARQFSRQMVDYLRQVLLLQSAGAELALDVPAEQQQEMLAQASRADREHLIAAVRAFNEAALASVSNWQPQLPLELAFIEQLPAAPLHAATPAPVFAQSQPPVVETPAPIVAEPSVAPGTQPSAAEEVAAPQPAPTSEKQLAQPIEAASESGDVLTLDVFRQHWAAMVQAVGQADKNLPPLLKVCQPIAVEGKTLILGFQFPVLKDKFEKKAGATGQVAEAFSALMGTQCTVRCVVTGDYAPSSGAGGSERDAFYALAEELGGHVRET